MKTKKLSGNVENYRLDGKLVIDTAPADQNVPFATASFRGWYRDHLVGQGRTVEEAIADLRAITGITEEAYIA